MITVLFFAGQQELIGENKLERPESHIKISDLKAKLMEEYPKLSLQHTMTAINEVYAEDEEFAEDNDIVAFIPPVSGG
ncbi:MoaD/ThiS family protein [Guptibacillus hwajinpoensis]|uniref:Molybdopterin synthase sulfur carrier subunit n=1 Tax=Guptibacillus hwajinpoensis TaxID=208199 RepID=A0ABU0K460_9BACL|nr:MoaD/ThiS family protein [Alkalihalobacillus hemicentroti]MDQ0483445.1 molybdopterin synthase sulfur carrier subunit [Alkalihalobacillus hemicentroti]